MLKFWAEYWLSATESHKVLGLLDKGNLNAGENCGWYVHLQCL